MREKEFLDLIIRLRDENKVVISEHGYEELAADGIAVRDVIAGLDAAVIVEYYPEYHKGPCVLLLQLDSTKRPIHVLWGTPKDAMSPAVVITAYRPDPLRWNSDFSERME